MKKLYTIALAAAVTLTASAQELAPAAALRVAKKAQTKQMVATQNPFAADMHKAGELGDLSFENLLGDYTWEFYQYLQGTSGGEKTSEITITAKDAAAGTVTVDLSGWEVEGSYADGTLTIAANQYLGYNEYNKIDVYLYHGMFNSDGANINFVDEPFLLSFDGEELYMPTIAGTGDLAGMDFDPNLFGVGNAKVGWFLMAGDNVIYKAQPYQDLEIPGTWSAIGTGKLIDGWQTIGFVGPVEYVNYEWDVVVEQNSEYPTIFRMANPYSNGKWPLAASAVQYVDAILEEGYIVFDITDPEFVMAYPLIYSGLTDNYGAYLNENAEGFYSLFVEGVTKQDIIEGLGLTKTSTYKDGVVTFENCGFATKKQPIAIANWKDEAGNPIVGASTLKITLPTDGILDIEASEAGEAVYYNLQGVRVAQPTSGVAIRIQGGKATKIAF